MSSEGKNATTLIRIHIDAPPTTTRKPQITTRTTETIRNTSSKTRVPTPQRGRPIVSEEVDVFKSTPDDNDSVVKSDNLESGNHQAFAFTVKENQARK